MENLIRSHLKLFVTYIQCLCLFERG